MKTTTTAIAIATATALSGCASDPVIVASWGYAAELVFKSFWTFAGTAILLSLAAGMVTAPFKYAYKAYLARTKMKTISENGYPPEHCDTLGEPTEPATDLIED